MAMVKIYFCCREALLIFSISGSCIWHSIQLTKLENWSTNPLQLATYNNIQCKVNHLQDLWVWFTDIIKELHYNLFNGCSNSPERIEWEKDTKKVLQVGLVKKLAILGPLCNIGCGKHRHITESFGRGFRFVSLFSLLK